MSQVRKGNRILTIEPHRVDDYVARGYDHIDEESGEVIKKGEPVSLADFKREYSSLKAQIKEKDARIVELEANAKTPAKASKTKKDTAEE